MIPVTAGAGGNKSAVTWPWIRRLSAGLASPPSDAAATEVFTPAIVPTIREMAQSIFTPERIQQLVSQLKKYKKELFAAGEKRAASYAFGAITYLERETEPALNSFLTVLCVASLQALGKETQ